MIKRYIPLILSAMILFTFCSKPAESDSESLSRGNIQITGAWALYPLVEKWKEVFCESYPQISIDVSAGGAGKGMTDVLSGLTDIGMISREINESETERGAFFIPVAKDAVFGTMNEQNPGADYIKSSGITAEFLSAVWMSGKTMYWDSLSDNEGKYPVSVYTRSDSCGAAETWAAWLGGTQEDLNGTGIYGDPGLADAVMKDTLGIGFNNLNYAFDFSTGSAVKGIIILPVDLNNNGILDPSEIITSKEDAVKAVKTGSYPSPPSRNLYLVALKEFRGVSKVFMQWILNEGQKYLDECGYISISDSELAEAGKKIE